VILGIDTSMGTSVALVADDGAVLAERAGDDPRGHAELIGPLLESVLRGSDGPGPAAGSNARAPRGPSAVTAVAVGMGPGPYTGLRVGIAAARAFAAALGVPVLGVVSHEAVREQLGLGPEAAVATPAGRRGHYLSVDGRIELTQQDPGDAVRPDGVSAAAVARVALRQRRLGEEGPQQPLYLREPDVAPPARSKRVR